MNSDDANQSGGSEAVSKSILRRIKKLLDRAEQDDKSPKEAAIAATEAARLMTKYRLDRAMVEAVTGERRSEPIGMETVFALPTKTLPGWIFRLARAVAECNHCKHFFSHEFIVVDGKRKYCRVVRAIGRATDLQAVKLLLEFVGREIERLAQCALAERVCSCGERKVLRQTCAGCGCDRESPRTYGTNFRIGAAETIGERLRALAKASDRGVFDENGGKSAEGEPPGGEAAVSQAIVLIRRDREEVDLYYRNVSKKLTFKSISHRLSRHSTEGREAGREAGRRVHLGPQLRQGASRE